MHTRFLHVRSKGAGGRGPREYFLRKTDAKGKIRDPQPRELFGNSMLFEELVTFSNSNHPYSSYEISYRCEPNPPNSKDRAIIHEGLLRLLRRGMAEKHIYAIGVDHGDHEHGAILRHIVTPKWPQFSPYYHAKDHEVLSMYQWLVNRRYGFAAPEDPRRDQLISAAGRHFTVESRDVVAELRDWIKDEWAAGHLTNHKDFVTQLSRRGFDVQVVHWTRADDTAGVEDVEDVEERRRRESEHDKRVYLNLTSRRKGEDIETLIKGPLCAVSFTRDTYESKRRERTNKYEDFLRDPFPMWRRFLEAIRKRRAMLDKRYAEFIDENPDTDYFGFENLHPDIHVIPRSFDASSTAIGF